ncbi:hypothetical protein [Kineococcus sp. SYSU DK002]
MFLTLNDHTGCTNDTVFTVFAVFAVSTDVQEATRHHQLDQVSLLVTGRV